MKKYFTLAAFAALLLCAACSNDTSVGPKELAGMKVTFSIDPLVEMGGQTPSTKVATSDDGTTAFEEKDEIGIFATHGATGNNVLHTVQKDLSLTSTEGVYYNGFGDKTADFYAYYPYNSANGGNAATLDFAVQEDQSTEAAYKASDFMTATSLEVPIGTGGAEMEDGSSVTLQFQHQMALVQVEVVLNHYVAAPSRLVINKCQTGLQWAYKDNAFTTTGEATDIQMWQRKASDNSIIYWALVPPQTIPQGQKLLTIPTTDTSTGKEQTFVLTTSKEMKFAAGAFKKFKVGIGANGQLIVFSTDLEAAAWGDDDDPTVADGELVRATTLMATTTFDDFTCNEVKNTKEEINAAGWWHFLSVKENPEVVEIVTESDGNKAIHFNRTINSWHNGTYYYVAEEVVAGTYVLRFKAKSTKGEPEEEGKEYDMRKNQLRIGAYMQEQSVDADGKTVTTDYFAIIDNNGNEATTVYKQITTEEYAEYEVKFDLSRVSTIHNATAANVTEASKIPATNKLLQKVVLYITSNVTGIDMYVDDISWVPAE